jgi:hypothetical protein
VEIAEMRLHASIAVIFVALSQTVLAQTDEIQVYDGGLASPGTLNLTLHTNFIASGRTAPEYPGAVMADKSLNGVPEWAYGVNHWFEIGLYAPVYSRDKVQGWGIDGVKLRALFAVPNADDRKFFYGTNFELSYNASRWDASRITSEVRPIIGWHLRPVDIIINPILDSSFDGIKNISFAPATRVAYNLSRMWAIAVEEYADLGPLRKFNPVDEQSHQLFGVVDFSGKAWSIESGVGFGLTNGSDKVTLKLILSHDLHK